MQKPFFSIIIVSLNPGEELKKTVESILCQTFTDYEIILKDGGSGDGSLDFLEEENEGRKKISLYERKDTGIYDAMNQAVEKVKGKYLLFLNCGDYLYHRKVLEKVKEEIEDFMRKEGSTFIFYGNLYNRKQEAIVSSAPTITDFTLYRNVPCHQVCFYDSSLFEERGYDLKYKVRADYEHFLYSIKKKNAAARAMKLIVASYEGGGYSETKENKRVSQKEHKEITQNYLGRKKCRKYRWILLMTLAPLRSRIAENPRLSSVYNYGKSLIYKGIKRGRK